MADDYLKAIYHHTEWQDSPITPSQLASGLGLAPSSVTEMVKKLAAQGLVTHRPYGPVSLTPAGQRRAAGSSVATDSSRRGWSANSATRGTRCTTRPRCSSTP